MSMGEINPFVSRRNFVRMFGAGVTVAAALPSLAQSTAGAPAGQARRGMGAGAAGADMGEMRQISPDTVIISSNENPLGPAQCALDEMIKAGPTGGRYDKFGVARLARLAMAAEAPCVARARDPTDDEATEGADAG